MLRPAAWLFGVRPYALLIGLCLALYLPGIAAIPPLDRDEARFAQASRQMLESGDFLRIRFQDEARNKKPAGIYWLQAAAVAAVSSPESTAIWPYRLPSLLGATAAALLVFAFGAALFRHDGQDPLAARRIGMAAAVLLGGAVGVVAEAHIAKTDAALLAAVTAGQIGLGLAYVRARAGRPAAPWIAAVFWAGEIAAIFLKGPVGPAIAAATALALMVADRDLRWLRGLRPLVGLLATAAAVLPWLIAIEVATSGRFIADSFGQDFLTKVSGAREWHGAPPLSYLLLSFATFWPGSLLLVPALLRGWRRRREPAERFLLAWLVPAWILLELVPTKLPHYALPLYPALALLAAAALAEGGRATAGWARRVELAGAALWVAAGVVLAAALIVLPLRFGGQVSAIAGIGAAAMVGLTLWQLPRRAAPLFAALSLAFVLPAGLAVMPGLDRLWLSRSAAELVAQHEPAAGAPLVAVGYNEPSLVFLLGTGLRQLFPADAATALESGGEALVANREAPAFLQAVAARGLAAQPLGSVAGLDYSNGQRMILTLYAVSAD